MLFSDAVLSPSLYLLDLGVFSLVQFSFILVYINHFTNPLVRGVLICFPEGFTGKVQLFNIAKEVMFFT